MSRDGALAGVALGGVEVHAEDLGYVYASIGITIDTYAHVLPKADQETAETLARLILGKP